MNLKRGNVISCGIEDKKFGEVNFPVTGAKKIREDFNLGVKLLHSFEYDEAEKVFARIIDEDPTCAMAYWGVAMSNFHPLWTPPSQEELKKGSQAIQIAQSISNKSMRETSYIGAISAFYSDWETLDHRSRCLKFEKAMEGLYRDFPEDKETAVFYTLALNAAADPSDKTFARQKKAGSILAALYQSEPNHPGVIHYLIHTYDSPELAGLAVLAARRYASVAPSSAHALHMPSHIFTRLGLWEESIQSNLASVASAQCYAQSAGIKGHWDEEIHGQDYLVYAYLQKGDNVNAKKHLDFIRGLNEITPFSFKVAYALAAIPSRYALENRFWKEAAVLQLDEKKFQWEQQLWPQAMIHFARALGMIHSGNREGANGEVKKLQSIHEQLLGQKDSYKAGQVFIQLKAAEAWLQWMNGNKKEALMLMQESAEAEDRTEKHPVTPGEVLPARELLGDLQMQLDLPAEALASYEASLKKHPNRFNGLLGAGQAAEKSGQPEKAKRYYSQLLDMVKSSNSDRPELKKVMAYLY